MFHMGGGVDFRWNRPTFHSPKQCSIYMLYLKIRFLSAAATPLPINAFIGGGHVEGHA